MYSVHLLVFLTQSIFSCQTATLFCDVAAKAITKKFVVNIHSTKSDRADETVNKNICEIERLDCRCRPCYYHKQLDKMVMAVSCSGRKNTGHSQFSPAEARTGAFDFSEIASHFITSGEGWPKKGASHCRSGAASAGQFSKAYFIVAAAGDVLPQIIERVAQLNVSDNFNITVFTKSQAV
jgi:hypothetical protein